MRGAECGVRSAECMVPWECRQQTEDAGGVSLPALTFALPLPHPPTHPHGLPLSTLQVDVWKYSSGDALAVASSGVARACIAGIPPGYARLEVREMAADECWSVDGYDT